MLKILQGAQTHCLFMILASLLIEIKLNSHCTTTFNGASTIRAPSSNSMEGKCSHEGGVCCVNEDHGWIPLIEHLKFSAWLSDSMSGGRKMEGSKGRGLLCDREG
ncbi:hypothetical protein JCGZ_24371 [Jatropha curcas]|uniref:Secreted protein n=1 Tax=Jatropha curcas TaxID=180498 RepID=A0A067L2D6_JATCU|nr:hypothetical protein JCGZ_24371 [Jatropha curcas]